MTTSFAVNWDYRCPFARNVHEHLITALEAGADWDVQFRAFSLDQTHVEPGEPAVWESPERYRGLLVNLAGIVVRDRFPDHFLVVHRALFAARHDEARDVRDRDVVVAVLKDHGVDGVAVLDEIDAGWPLETLRDEHLDAAQRLEVWGVPTFIARDRAVFVRLLDRPEGDALKAQRSIQRVVDLITDFPELNEFKYMTVPF
jgi:hypothetical protein